MADSKIDDSGPASPLVLPKKLDGRGSVIENDVFPGLTKREFFAAQALAGICANPAWNDTFHSSVMKPSAEAAVAMADALISALKEGA